MKQAKRRLTVSLDDDDQTAVETICSDMGSPSASAALRRAVRELAEQIDKRRGRASRLPTAAA